MDYRNSQLLTPTTCEWEKTNDAGSFEIFSQTVESLIMFFLLGATEIMPELQWQIFCSRLLCTGEWQPDRTACHMFHPADMSNQYLNWA